MLALNGAYARLMADQSFVPETASARVAVSDGAPEVWLGRGETVAPDEEAQVAPTDAILRAEGLG